MDRTTINRLPDPFIRRVAAFVAAYPSVLKGRRHALVVNAANTRQAWLESTLYKVETGAIVAVFGSILEAQDWVQRRE